MEDICIGRKTKIKESAVATAAAFSTLVEGDADRLAVIIASQAAGDIFITSISSTGITGGFNVPVFRQPLELTLEKYGTFVNGRILARTPAGADTVQVLEVRLEKECEK